MNSFGLSHEPSSPHKQRILFVDDEVDIREIFRQGLEQKGLHVDAYSSPQEALGAFEPNMYDLAILDIRMPVMSGFELYREMKKGDPAITVCFLSDFEMYAHEFRKVFPSMKDVKTIIKKPLSINELLKQITPSLKISAIARAVPGEHILIVFETHKELVEQALECLKIGLLEKEEDVMLVTDAIPVERIRNKIASEWKIDIVSMEGTAG